MDIFQEPEKLTNDQVTQRIHARLVEIEKSNDVTIFYACESGSRAWGFHSPDSDYDVRFLYVRSPDWYLSISRGRDVIDQHDYPIVDDIDLSGWDLTKALSLLRVSNPSILEYLRSPITYGANEDALNGLQQLSGELYSPERNFKHYFGMASDNFKSIESQETPTPKRYLYTLRGVLAAQFITENGYQPPISFNELVSATVDKGHSINKDIDTLLVLKQATNEKVNTARLTKLDDFIENRLRSLASWRSEDALTTDSRGEDKSYVDLDRVFRNMLNLLRVP